MKSKLTSWCDTVLELGWLAAVIVTPLFFNVHSDRVFEPDKITLVRSIAVLMLGVYIVRYINEGGWRDWSWINPRSRSSVWYEPFVLPVSAVVLTYLISSYFSVTPSVSWAGSYQRLQGTYSTFSYIIIFGIMALTMRSEAQIHRVVTTVIIVSIPVSLYGILQRNSLDPLPWGGNTVRRIAGHMGNAIFVAAYLIMVVPLTLGRIISSFTSILGDEELNVADIIRSSIYIFVLAIQLMAIYWTFSRGPLIGLLIGIFVFITIFLVSLRNSVNQEKRNYGQDLLIGSSWFVVSLVALIAAAYLRPVVGNFGSFAISLGVVAFSILVIFVLIALRVGWSWLWLAWIQLAVFGVLWLGAFNLTSTLPESARSTPVTGTIIQAFDSWKVLDGVGRYGTLLEVESKTAQVRIFIWRGAADLITPHEPIVFPDGTTDRVNFLRPLIGYGPESMYVAYNRFYPPELGTVEKRNASPDRSHNETWDALVITGLLGFAAWQWLYLAIFLNTFSWLGVLKSRRDRLTLIALWFGAGIAMTLIFVATFGTEFVGVALPFGSIFGLVLYLIYYAIVARPDESDIQQDPFQRNTLIMIAILGAVTAYFVEIHFGIAIASTRTHFFVFAGLLVVLGYYLPQRGEEKEPVLEAEDETLAAEETVDAAPAKKERRKGRGRSKGKRRSKNARSGSISLGSRRSSAPEWVMPVGIWAFVMTLILMILGFNFIVFTPPPDLQIRSIADLPSAWDIFQQAMFVNPSQNFAESPFIYMLIIMTWILGVLIALSEMVKNGYLEIKIAAPKNQTLLQPIGIGLLVASVVFVGLVIYGYFVIGRINLAAQPTARIGYIALAPIGALLCGISGWRLVSGEINGRFVASSVSLAGLLLSLPIMMAGGVAFWIGMILGSGSLILLALLWQNDIGQLIRPAGFVAGGSLVIGLSYMLIHAARIRQNFITPEGIVQQGASEAAVRVAEADQYVGILTLFYILFFAVLLIMAIFSDWRTLTLPRLSAGSMGGILSLVIIFPLAFSVISVTNLRIIQADMIYKRGKPWDTEATRASDNPENASRFWDNTIAIYERALELAPREDFYYLWLGRAYLEKSAYLEGAARDDILETAEDSLFTAQNINPLNTDHTANLARLNTRWAALSDEAASRNARVTNADNFYQSALDLSPQNSTIHNEYARMIFGFTQDCERVLDIYAGSVEADPLFEQTRYQIAETAINCANIDEDPTQYYDTIVTSIEEGAELARGTNDLGRRWLTAAQTFQQFEAYDYAIDAYEQALNYPDDQYPEWRIKYFLATAHSDNGDDQTALDIATDSLNAAPAEVAPQIEEFINELNVG